MEAKDKNFEFLKALEITSFLLLVLFVVFFFKTIMAIFSAIQTDVYTNVVAGLNSM